MTNVSTSCSSKVPVLNASQVDFGKLKGKGSFCNVVEVKSFPAVSSLERNPTSSSSGENTSWDAKPKKAPTLNNSKSLLSFQRKTNSGNLSSNDENFSNSNLSKLTLRVSDSTSKLRNLLLNSSCKPNSNKMIEISNQQTLVAKLPK